jgi:hypothetical protein
LNGEEIDMSFIPCAITFDVDKLVREISELSSNQDALLGNEDNLRKVFDNSVELCALFCSVKHPEITKEWLFENTNPIQVRAIVDQIRIALADSYAGVEKYGKN